MKNTDFPKNECWKKIVDEAFSSDEIHEFSDSYNQKKAELQKGIVMKKTSKNNKKRIISISVAAAAAIVVIPGSVMAYNKLAGIRKTASYQNTVTIETDENASPEIKSMSINYLPKGAEPFNEGGCLAKYNSECGSFSVFFYKLADGDALSQALNYSVEYDEYEYDGRTIMINHRAEVEMAIGAKVMDRECYIVFDGTPYFAQAYFENSFTDEEVKKICEGLSLEDSAEETAAVWRKPETYQRTAAVPPQENNDSLDGIVLHKVGETVTHDELDYPESCSNCSVTLNNIRVQKTMDGITDCGMSDFSEFVDENGNILDNEIKYIRYGDGVNTLDEVIATEKVPQSIVVLDLTYTNLSDYPIEYCVCPDMWETVDGKPYRMDLVPKEMNGADMAPESLQHLKADGMFFAFDIINARQSSKNNIMLDAGESGEVQLAFCLDEDKVDNCFLQALTFGRGLNDDIAHGSPFFSISGK